MSEQTFADSLHARCADLKAFAEDFQKAGIEVQLYGDCNSSPCHFYFLCRGENEPDVRRLVQGAYQILSGNNEIVPRVAPEVSVGKDFCSDRMMAMGFCRLAVLDKLASR